MAARKKKVSNIAEQLQELAVPIDSLREDERNVRWHSKRNLSEIRKSLRRFGQVVPVVVQQSSMKVVAGNARLQAARSLGWTHIAANIVDMDDRIAKAYSIADNRTGELAEWDEEALGEALAELRNDELIDFVGFNEEEIDEVASTALADFDDDDTGSAGGRGRPQERMGDYEFRVLVHCDDEKEQAEVIEKLNKEGHRCQALTS